MPKASCDLSVQLTPQFQKFIVGCLTYTKQVGKQFVARFTGKDLANDMQTDPRIVRRFIDRAQKQGLVQVTTRRGRNGGYLLQFNQDLIHFDNPDTILNAPEEPVSNPDAKDEQIHMSPTKTAQRESRGALMRRLNSMPLSYDMFKELDNPDEAFGGYLVGKAYDRYNFLFVNKQAIDMGKSPIVNENYSQFKAGKLFGSANLTTFTEVYKMCRDLKINPVYYLSAIFSNAEFLASNRHKLMTVPYVNTLMSRMDEFKSQEHYDKTYFKTSMYAPHQTIQFVDNPEISLIHNYFQEVIIKGETPEQFADDLREDATIFNQKVLEDADLPDDFFGDKNMCILVKSGKAWLNQIKLKLEKTSYSKHEQELFMQSLTRVYTQEIKGTDRTFRNMMAFDPISKATHTRYFKSYTLTDLLEDKFSDREADNLMMGTIGFEKHQWNLIHDKINTYEDVHKELKNHWWHYLNVNNMYQIGELISQRVKITDETLDLAKFRAIIRTVGYDLLPLDNYGRVSLDRLVQGYAKLVKQSGGLKNG